MNYFAIAVVLCGAVFLSTSGVEAQCYNCTYTDVGFQMGQKGCMDTFDKTGISEVPCSGKCIKRISVFGSLSYTERKCFDEPGPCEEFINKEFEGQTGTQTCCTGPLCNAAGVINFSVALAIFAPIGALLF